MTVYVLFDNWGSYTKETPRLETMTRREFIDLIDGFMVIGNIKTFEEAREECWQNHIEAYENKREMVDWLNNHISELWDCLTREDLDAYVGILEKLTGKTAFFVNEYKRGETNNNYVVLAKDLRNAMRQAKGYFMWANMTLSDKHGNELAYKSWLGRWERAEEER